MPELREARRASSSTSPEAFYDWLAEHHETEDEVFVGMWKKATGKQTMTWSQAVDQALCFGWIDGVMRRIDDERHMQRFTPRRPGSNWSKVNVEKVARLEAEGLMTDGRSRRRSRRGPTDKTGVYSFEAKEAAELPPEFAEQLAANDDCARVLRGPGAVVQAHRHPLGRERKARGDAGETDGTADRVLCEGRGPAAVPLEQEAMSKFSDPVVITCSISGAVANRDQCPAIPYTPEEYAAEARRIVDEGGSMIHIHARSPDGVPSYEIEDFRAITEAINAEVDDVIINYSTGAIGVPIEKRIEYLRELKPDVAALNMSSMNYAKYSKSRKDFVFKAVFENSFDTIIEFLTAMNELGIRAEHECFDTGHVANLDPLLDMGLLREPLQISCVMGVTGGIRPNARNLAHMAEQVPGGPEGRNNWGVIGVSRKQWQLVAASLTLGGNVRVGPGGQLLPAGRRDGEVQRRADRQGAADDRGRRPPRGDRRGGARAARRAQARGGMTTHAAQVSWDGRQGGPARPHRPRGRPDDRRLVLAGVGRGRGEGRPRGAVRRVPVGLPHALVRRPGPPGAPARDQLRGQRRRRDGRHPLHVGHAAAEGGVRVRRWTRRR